MGKVMILSFTDDEEDIYKRILQIINGSKNFEQCSAFQNIKLIQAGKLWIDYMQRNVCVNNIEIELTYIEFEILYLLVGNPGRVFRKEQIYMYCGMETGSDKILQLINKGFHADTVVESGCMAKDAGMILSEFILLGIGGKEFSEENAIQTAKALNVIQPDFIRVHATGIKLESKMWEFVQEGSFTLQSEEEIMIEQKLFLEKLLEMDSYYVNEHIVNLLLEVRGKLQTDKMEMLSAIDNFLGLPEDEKLLFIVGRRLNIFFLLDDLKNPELYRKAQECMEQILQKNPQVDFTRLCNYVRQSQI